MTDFAAARRHMVDGQIRTIDVTDLRVISAMLEVPRERFMQPASVSLAYLDLDVPVGGGRRLLRPMVLAKLIQAAELEAGDCVLDVGCATGYGAALLGRIAGDVVALEQDTGLAKTAGDLLLSQPNVSVVTGTLAEAGRKTHPTMSSCWRAPPRSCRTHCANSSRMAADWFACSARAPVPRPCFTRAAAGRSEDVRCSTPPQRCCRASQNPRF